MTKQEIKVPSMGESITEATVAAILKPSGSLVALDEEIVELETDKVNQVLYAPIAGTLALTVAVDTVVKIGDTIGYVEMLAGGESPAKELTAQPAVAEERSGSVNDGVSPAEEPTVQPAVAEERLGSTEAVLSVKSTAEEEMPTARYMKSSFVEEIKRDTDTAKRAGDAAEPIVAVPTLRTRSVRREKMSKIRKVIAKRLVEAQATTAMLTTFNEVDMSAVMELRRRYKEPFLKEYGVKLGFMSFFVSASVAALKTISAINGYVDGDELVYHDYYDIGIAVGTKRGLVVPVLRDCEALAFHQIERGIVAYADKAKTGGLTVDDLRGATFTITNGGVYGSLFSTPILNPPQSGILGMHKIELRPIAVEGKVEIRPMMYVALSYDHRIVDGREAVTFLVHLKNSLEDPTRLLLGV